MQALQEQCDETVAEKTKLMEAQAQTALRLTNAEKLTSGLSSDENANITFNRTESSGLMDTILEVKGK